MVAFSRKDIYALKAQIEAQTPHRCAMVYGRLPPETRAQQAKLFNTPGSGYDVLVASDAVGMGLNLYVATPGAARSALDGWLHFNVALQRGGEPRDPKPPTAL